MLLVFERIALPRTALGFGDLFEALQTAQPGRQVLAAKQAPLDLPHQRVVRRGAATGSRPGSIPSAIEAGSHHRLAIFPARGRAAYGPLSSFDRGALYTRSEREKAEIPPDWGSDPDIRPFWVAIPLDVV